MTTTRRTSAPSANISTSWAAIDERFYCTDEYWADENQALEFEIKASGITRKLAKAAALAAPALGIGATAAHARPHG